MCVCVCVCEGVCAASSSLCAGVCVCVCAGGTRFHVRKSTLHSVPPLRLALALGLHQPLTSGPETSVSQREVAPSAAPGPPLVQHLHPLAQASIRAGDFLWHDNSLLLT